MCDEQEEVEEQQDEQEQDDENHDIPFFDLESEIEFPETPVPGSPSCLDWIKKQQHNDQSIFWLMNNLQTNLKLLDAIMNVFGTESNDKDKNKVGFFATLFRARAKMKVKDDILRIQHDDGHWKREVIVLNPFMAKELIHIIHTKEGSSHFGISKTIQVFNQYFYCPGSQNYISKYIKTCKPCVDAKHLEVGKPPLGRTSSLPHPRLKYWLSLIHI